MKTGQSHEQLNEHEQGNDNGEYGHEGGEHGHTHGVVDPTIATTSRGLWAVKWSFVGLGITAVFQMVVFIMSGSVALLGDTIHNLVDAATAVPLLVAFLLARRKPNTKFTYGYYRVEDLAGAAIVLMIFLSAVVIAYESIDRFINPQPVSYVWAVALAGVIGFIGNEGVALFRIKVGREINSAALVADGHHARADGLTSLAVVASAAGIWLGFPLADPVIGLLMTVLILRITWQSGQAVFTRMLDGVDPHIIENIVHEASEVSGVQQVSDVRARWLGHRLEAELHVAVKGDLSVEKAHAMAAEMEHNLRHEFSFMSNVIVHVDPASAAGLRHHRIAGHEHNGLPLHAH